MEIPGPKQPEKEQTTLVERLEAAKVKAKAVEERNRKSLEESSIEGINFSATEIRILKREARTKAIVDGRLEDRALIDSYELISDEIIPDAHKNEITISEFRKRFL